MQISKYVIAILISFIYFKNPVFSQPLSPRAFKTLNVSDGLPQSFISGLVQDNTGFIWIGTRDGLARYDGRKFKIFRHIPGDSTTLSGNIVAKLYLDKKERLWIAYESGEIDVLNTQTETLYHVSKNFPEKYAYTKIKSGYAITEDLNGNIWLLCANDDLLIYNLENKTFHFYSDTTLGLKNNRISGITQSNANITLVTDSALIAISEQGKILESVSYSFWNLKLINPFLEWVENENPVNRRTRIIIRSEDSLIIYYPALKTFAVIPLPKGGNLPLDCLAKDNKGNLFFYYDNAIYYFSSKDKFIIWKPEENSVFAPKSMLIDRSGTLWIGGNGSGIKLYDLRLSRWSGQPYKKNFHEDLLQKYLQVPAKEIKNSFLYDMLAYRFRSMNDYNGKIWLSIAGGGFTRKPELCYYKNGHLFFPPWRYVDTSIDVHRNINALAISKSGKLWGMDFFLRLIYFDTLNYSVTVSPPVASANLDQEFTVNSLLIDNEDDFWFSTAHNGLYYYNKQNGKTINYSDASGYLPTSQLMNMIKDPSDDNILWIGSLGGGLIKFNKTTDKCRAYTTNDGLPNNTVYAVIADAHGILWCSSNKGIFSFNPKTKVVKSFISKDGLPGDEYNRYHYLQFPDGQIAFGGVDGYTVFNPLSIAYDTFQPPVALTAIKINNTSADFGYHASPFKKAINSLDKIVLPYDQNFLTFEFAGLEYNITEKLQYRYMLESFNKAWVNAGNENVASYTNIPPGLYLLKINATNTAGIWSSQIKTLSVIIEPPFWKTWWFTCLWVSAIAILVYLFFRYRIAGVRKEEQQKAAFEREALELKAEALRAQMNPHFIFNCLNSIKSLIQKDKKQQAVIYLTTFSKLIRNQLNNAQREISLHEELETCRLYTQLEALRFGTKIICEFEVEEGIDTYSLHVPPLVLQPFIENAIWHGILPKDGGNVKVAVSRNGKCIQCTIEDDGIGRELSLQNKSQTSPTYQSKGMKLVQGRLNLHNSINNHGGTVELIDKKDTHGNGSGTMVIIKFKEA